MPDWSIYGLVGFTFLVALQCAQMLVDHFSPEARARRVLQAARRVSIDEAPAGKLVKLVGRLSYDPAASHVESSLTHRRCALFEASVLEERRAGKESSWKQIIKESGHVAAFVLDDGSGQVLVDCRAKPRGLLVMDSRTASGPLSKATAQQEAFLARHGQSSLKRQPRKLYYFEGALKTGDQVAVVGHCVREPSPDARVDCVYRGQAMRVRIEPPPGGWLLISDEPSLMEG